MTCSVEYDFYGVRRIRRSYCLDVMWLEMLWTYDGGCIATQHRRRSAFDEIVDEASIFHWVKG